MICKKLCFALAFIVFAASACGESTKKKNNDTGDEEEEEEISSDAGVEDPDEIEPEDPDNPDSGSDRSDSGRSSVFPINLALCGNNVVEDMEECDDGDMDQKNGCTSLCTYSCTEDSECDDMNDCNGVEKCDSHACVDADEPLGDGETCGENKSCWRGVCVFNICGDGKPAEDEACDDGNLDPNDGCTPDCQYSCEDDEDCSGQDECLGDRTCEDHMCVGGSELDDKTPCEINDERTKKFCGDTDVERDGWCMAGVCTCTDCGDGEVSGIEECDDGPLNGTDDSPNNCSLNCRVVKCQNGSVEGDEECDDGNDQRLDGCDPDCKFEFAHRFTSMEIKKDVDIPEWCAHQANRFSEAFAEEVMIMGLMSLNILETVNQTLSTGMAQGDNAYLIHVKDSDDISMQTADEDITLALYQGYPYTELEDPVDIPFVIQASQVDQETREPAEYHSVAAEQVGGGAVSTKEPSNVKMMGVTGDEFMMHDLMMQLVFDVHKLSVPNSEKLVARDTIEVSESLLVPEESGVEPQGLYCGAMESGAADAPIVDQDFAELDAGQGYGPMASFCCKNTGPEIGTKYRGCDLEAGDEIGKDCDSVSDLIKYGCTICINMEDMTDVMGILDEGSRCEFMEESPDQCFKIINGIEFDVDTDGDGENDTWSSLFGFSAMRTRIYDVALSN